VRRRGPAHWLRQRVAERIVAVHLADSPDLADELRSVGLQATVCRLLPSSIEAEVIPLPGVFRVLSYWFDDRRSFYGGDTIIELARRMPDVEFLIAGAFGKGAVAPANVRFLGRVTDMDPIYAQTSVFLRLPKHDSLSVMVLEALARGRYVIYNKNFPHCLRADSLEQVQQALNDVRCRRSSNLEGADFVKQSFRLDEQAQVLARVYAGLRGES
jgi:hypothetical protein